MPVNVAVFSAQPYDEASLTAAAADKSVALTFFPPALTQQTCAMAKGFSVVCVFVNDTLDAEVISTLHALGVKHIALRCAGYNNVDLACAQAHNIAVSRVPAYSPETVAEHTLALILTLNRKTHHAYNRVREGNFSLNGLLGFTLHNKTVGVVGTGEIGLAVVRILRGFGCRVLCCDPQKNPAVESLGGEYVSADVLFDRSQIITLHCPLTEHTAHFIDADAIAKMQKGVMLINTSRGAIVDTRAAIDGLKQKKIGALGIDVYEQEAGLFFTDRSLQIIDDDVFERLLTFPNVLITGHQGFFTQEALTEIANTTISNIEDFAHQRATQKRFLLS